MNPLDWLLAALFAYSIVRAAARGFFREAFALGGIVLGFLLACWNYSNLAPRLKGLVDSTPLSDLLAFILLLMATMVVATLAGKLLSRTASVIGLGLVDRLGGALFGALRGVLLGTTLLLAVTAFLPAAPWMQTSSLAPYFLRAVHAVSFVMPSDLRQRFVEGLERLEHTTPQWINPGPLSKN
jgi:membrane protein required for colicin V production